VKVLEFLALTYTSKWKRLKNQAKRDLELTIKKVMIGVSARTQIFLFTKGFAHITFIP